MLTLVGILCVLGVVGFLVHRRQTSAQLRNLVDQLDRKKLEPGPVGRISTERVYVGTRPAGDHEIDVFISRTTVTGIFPRWVIFGWTRETKPHWESRDLNRNQLWMHILGAESLVASLPSGSTLYARDGDLVFESDISPSPISNPRVPGFSESCPQAEDELFERVVDYASSGPAELRAIATRILVRHFPKHASTERVLREAASSSDAELRAIAAAADEHSSPEVLRAIADDPAAGDAARVEAIQAMIWRHHDHDLLALTAHPVPETIATSFIQELRRIKDERCEPTVRAYLDTGARAAAIDALAVLGTSDSVIALREVQARKNLSDEEKVGVEVAVELIRERLEGRQGATKGAISIVGDSEGGALSVAPVETGALSLDADEK